MADKDSDERTCLLYLVSPVISDVNAFVPLLEKAVSAVEGRVGAFLLRLESMDAEALTQAASILRPICHDNDVAFILQERADIALRLNADGVHFAESKPTITESRKLVDEEMILGASCGFSRDAAISAGDAGADYVTFGPFTKGVDLDILQWWQEYVVIPCVAEGEISPENCGSLVKAGADFISPGEAFWQQPGLMVKAFDRAITEALQSL